jgi:rhodanese-related sulfurtransferase
MFIRQLRMDRISIEELTGMIDRGEAPVILDVRPDLVRYEQGIIPGAIFAHPLDAQEILAAYPRDTEVVVYCSCPNEESAATAAKHLKAAGFHRIRPLLGGIEAWSAAGRPVATIGLT